MKDKITVNCAVISHIGNIRKNNEDNFYFDGDMMLENEVNDGAVVTVRTSDFCHLFSVCDGMGGLEGGERASMICVNSMKTLHHAIPAENIVDEIDTAIRKMNDDVLADSAVTGKGQTEGSTVALLYLQGNKGYVANVGDSRVYLLRKGKMSMQSQDHSLVYQMMLRGELTLEQMRKHPRANAISHFVGMPKEKLTQDFVFHQQFDLINGDRFLICSDGLTDLISQERLEKLLGIDNTPEYIARKLILEALELGGKDNVTVIIGDISGNGLQRKPLSEVTGMVYRTEISTENSQ